MYTHGFLDLVVSPKQFLLKKKDKKYYAVICFGSVAFGIYPCQYLHGFSFSVHTVLYEYSSQVGNSAYPQLWVLLHMIETHLQKTTKFPKK